MGWMVWFQLFFSFMYGLVWFWGGSQTIGSLALTVFFLRI
jgi:hypothetical protein